MKLMNVKQIRPSVLYLIVGAILGASAAALFAYSQQSLIDKTITGLTMCLEPCGNSSRLTGVIIAAGAIIGGLLGAVAGSIKERLESRRKRRDEHGSAPDSI